jgi:peptidoglycan/LPS O-acetylase OafA/YrhL
MTDEYRSDIDGLRAIAVIAVVLHHVGIPGVPGGFVGVDVFYVISGFLITAQLLSHRAMPVRQFLLDFYARRARRILPALALMVTIILLAGGIVLLANGEQQDLARSAVATSLFGSNIYFYHHANDYFAQAAELQPLLHTWSLGVEEQFYIAWPILLVGCWALERKLGIRRAALWAIVAGSIASFALTLRWTATDPMAAFYLAPPRAWELGAGALLAFARDRRALPSASAAWSAVGLLVIAASVLLYDTGISFPGLFAMLPVVGSALVIAAGEMHRDGIGYRFLSQPAMTLTGRVSYAWYLWHWPLLSLARTNDLGVHRLGRDASLAIIAYGIAYLSYRYVETPIRQRRVAAFSRDRRALFAGLALTTVCILGTLGLRWHARNGFREHYAGWLLPETLGCLAGSPGAQDMLGDSCQLGSAAPTRLFLVGDSHADHWSAAIKLYAHEAGLGAIERARISCNVVVVSQVTSEEGKPWLSHQCVVFARRVMDEVGAAARRQRVVVVVSAEWLSYFGSGQPARLEFERDLHNGLEFLEKNGASVLLVGETPRFPFSAPACMARRAVDVCSIARATNDSALFSINEVLTRTVARSHRVRFWDPSSYFCDSRWCYAVRNGVLLFRDGDHLSRIGAESAASQLAVYLDQLLGSATSVANGPSRTGLRVQIERRTKRPMS